MLYTGYTAQIQCLCLLQIWNAADDYFQQFLTPAWYLESGLLLFPFFQKSCSNCYAILMLMRRWAVISLSPSCIVPVAVEELWLAFTGGEFLHNTRPSFKHPAETNSFNWHWNVPSAGANLTVASGSVSQPHDVGRETWRDRQGGNKGGHLERMDFSEVWQTAIMLRAFLLFAFFLHWTCGMLHMCN